MTSNQNPAPSFLEGATATEPANIIPKRTPDEIEEHIRRLFSPHGIEDSIARILDDRVDVINTSFLTRPDVSSSFHETQHLQYYPASKMPSEGIAPEEYLNFLEKDIIPHAVNTAHRRCVGQMTTVIPHLLRPLAKLTAGMNQNMVRVETSKSLTPLERKVLAMLHGLLFHRSKEFYTKHAASRESTLGILTSGGTNANLIGMWIARNSALPPSDSFAGIEREGLARGLAYHGYRRAVIIGSEAMHYSFKKAADILGLGTRNLRVVKRKSDYTIDVDACRREIEHCAAEGTLVLALVGIAGNTDAGAVDRLDELAELAEEFNLHFHVDAAWGGPFLFSSKHRDILTGIDRADTVALDGHKQFHVPVGTGILCIKDPASAQCIEKEANYIIRPESVDLGKRSLEGSRPANVLALHAAIYLIGVHGYEYLVDRNIATAKKFAKAIEAHDAFEILVAPQTNIILYRYVPEPDLLNDATIEKAGGRAELLNKINAHLQQSQWERGLSFVSRTMIARKTAGGVDSLVALRAVIANPFIEPDDFDCILSEQAEIAREYIAEHCRA